MAMLVTNDPEMTHEEFELFREFIHEKAGIYFADSKTYLLKNRLAKRIADLGFKNFKDYFYRVKYDVTMKEFGELMNLVTTNETSFFRNPPQLKSFAEEALPQVTQEILIKGAPKKLRLWSAGCSTGEEPYTIAMLVMEHLKSTPGWNIEIIGTDISERALAAARVAEYNELTMRGTPPEYMRKYFICDGERYKLKPEVKSMVKFAALNLNDSRKLSLYTNMDFIFCRNVMIYFSDEVRHRLVRNIYNMLRPGGYFYIGHSESLHGVSKAFKLVYFKNALVYHKEQRAVLDDRSPGRKTEYGAAGANRAMELLQRIKPLSTGK